MHPFVALLHSLLPWFRLPGQAPQDGHAAGEGDPGGGSPDGGEHPDGDDNLLLQDVLADGAGAPAGERQPRLVDRLSDAQRQRLQVGALLMAFCWEHCWSPLRTHSSMGEGELLQRSVLMALPSMHAWTPCGIALDNTTPPLARVWNPVLTWQACFYLSGHARSLACTDVPPCAQESALTALEDLPADDRRAVMALLVAARGLHPPVPMGNAGGGAVGRDSSDTESGEQVCL